MPAYLPSTSRAPLSSPQGGKSQRTGSLPYGGRFGGGLVCLLVCLLWCQSLCAQRALPTAEGEKARYRVFVEMPRGYVSGICILMREGESLKGSIFNEFGISAMDFTYSLKNDKVKLHNLMKMRGRWYVRRVLRKDLRHLIHQLQQGCYEYTDQKHHISFKLTPLEN